MEIASLCHLARLAFPRRRVPVPSAHARGMTVARSVLALVACMVLLVSRLGAAHTRATTGQPQGSEETHAPTRFDIDAQPLAAALRAFSEAAGVAVLFDDALVAQRESQGIHATAE